MITQHFNATAEIEALQQQRALARQQRITQSCLKKCRGEIVALLKAKGGSYRLVAQWLKRHKHIYVSHTTVMRFAKQLPELQEHSMPSFRKLKAQAERAVRYLSRIGSARHTHRDDQKIHSLGTQRNYIQALTRVTEWLQANRLGDLRSLTSKKAIQYLEERSEAVGQKLLDQERQAMQKLLQQKLPVIKSELVQIQKSRSYSSAQIEAIAKAQNDKNQLATQLAHAAGLRAHELLTLRKKEERSASAHRTWSSDRFLGREGTIYTVVGKGGLIREVLIPTLLTQELENKRLTTPIKVKDRSIYYTKYYDINGGKNWSNSFTNASKRALGRSNGAHGVRHSYAQDRMEELQQRGIFYQDALGIVSQEMGHFRPNITEVYLI